MSDDAIFSFDDCRTDSMHSWLSFSSKAFLTFCSGTQKLIAVGRDGLGNEEGRGRAVLADHKTFRVKLVSVAALMSFWSDVLRSSL